MTYSMNAPLTLAQSQVNAQYIWEALRPLGWTKNAVAGMLGNMYQESGINPGAYQSYDDTRTDLGYGLVQWTPATKYFTWADAQGLPRSAIDSQIQRILWEVRFGEQWFVSIPMTFLQFTKSIDTPYNLAMLFGQYYERYAGWDTAPQTARGTQAEYWYTFLTGETTGTGITVTDIGIWMQEWYQPHDQDGFLNVDANGNSYFISVIAYDGGGTTIDVYFDDGIAYPLTPMFGVLQAVIKSLDSDRNLRWTSPVFLCDNGISGITSHFTKNGDKLLTFDTIGSGIWSSRTTIIQALNTSTGALIFQTNIDGNGSGFTLDDFDNIYLSINRKQTSKSYSVYDIRRYSILDGSLTWRKNLYTAGTPNDTNIATFVGCLMWHLDRVFIIGKHSTVYWGKFISMFDGSEIYQITFTAEMDYGIYKKDKNGNFYVTDGNLQKIFSINYAGSINWTVNLGIGIEIEQFYGIDDVVANKLYIQMYNSVSEYLQAINLSDGSVAWQWDTQWTLYDTAWAVQYGNVLVFATDNVTFDTTRAIWFDPTGTIIKQQDNVQIGTIPFSFDISNTNVVKSPQGEIYIATTYYEPTGIYKLSLGLRPIIPRPHEPRESNDLIHLLLSDCLNGWKW